MAALVASSVRDGPPELTALLQRDGVVARFYECLAVVRPLALARWVARERGAGAVDAQLPPGTLDSSTAAATTLDVSSRAALVELWSALVHAPPPPPRPR